MITQLTDVRGIGPSTARALETLGIRSVADLAKASPAQVAKVPGFGETRAAEVIAAAEALLAATGTARAAVPTPEPEAPAVKAAPSEGATAPPAMQEKVEKQKKKKVKGKKADKKKKKGKKKKGKKK